VGWARVATQVVVGNSDAAEHNIHGYKETLAATQFNFASPPAKTIDNTEAAYLEKPAVYLLKCDIHPWMNGYLHVAAHPYFDVTSEKDGEGGRKAGQYALTDVPHGEWEVVCWHEGMEEKPLIVGGKLNWTYSQDVVVLQKVTVAPGQTVTQDFVVPYR
jgi:plastocyanin